MKNSILKSKSTLGILGLVTVSVVGVLSFAKVQYDNNMKGFVSSGHIITTDEEAQSLKYEFTDGTNYKSKLGDVITFEDKQSNEVEVSTDNFVFYDDGAVGALSKGVLLDIEDVRNDQYINNYSLASNATITSGNNGIGISNGIDDIFVEEAIWKISDEKYLVMSDNINVVFTEEDERPAQDYILLNYVDSGVVQIITEENVWQTVSTTAYLETDNGAVINLYDQLIEYDGSQMLMSKLIIDADDNIEVSPLETLTQALPTFDITGESGSEGSSGEFGDSGDSGSIGSNGTTGTQGDGGTSGATGESGTSGDDVMEGSTAATNIPTVSITDWSISAKGIEGTYSVFDEDGIMSSNLTIVIYESGTGEEYICVDEYGYTSEFVTYKDVTFMNDVSLKPDTEYTLSISGDFEMNGTVHREFVSKTFYTDSLGLFVSADVITDSSISINIEQMDYSLAKSVAVYVLPESESQNFDPDNLAYKYTDISLTPLTESVDNIIIDSDFTFPDGTKLQSNTTYTIRMVMELQGEASEYLSYQVLSITTLKETPIFSGNAIALSNRSSWAFELYGCNVLDPDLAIESYIYDVYEVETGKLVRTFNVNTSSTSEMVNLYIDEEIIKVDTKYYFQIKAIYNDNVKTIEKIVSTSGEFSMAGTQLPALHFVKSTEVNDNEYENINGILYITTNGSKLIVDSANPLYIYIESEGVYEKTIKIDSINDLTVWGENGYLITISEYGLNANKIYRISATGTVDCRDGNDPVTRSLGQVSVTTDEVPSVRVVWSTPDDLYTSNVFAKQLNLISDGNENVLADGSMESKTLSQVNVQLCMATDSDIVLGEATFVDTDSDIYISSLTTDFTNGVVVKETDFGLTETQLSAEDGYILRVSAVYDYTMTHPQDGGANVNGYVNEFTIKGDASTAIKPNELPALLPAFNNLDNQITATPIYNKDASTYGVNKDGNLLDNSIVGMTLEFAYENSSRLARELNVYAFESGYTGASYDSQGNKMELVYTGYNGAYNPSNSNGNLIPSGDTGAKWVFENKLSNLSKDSYYLPKVAIIFGSGADTTYGVYEVMYAPNMNRGNMYTFAYTVGYSETYDGDEATHVYPYQYGGFAAFTQSERMKYLLNSGEVEAPYTSPAMYGYIINQGSGKDSSFNVYYVDVDKTLVRNKGETSNIKDTNGETAGNVGDDFIEKSWNRFDGLEMDASKTSYGLLFPINLYKSEYSKATTQSVASPTDGGKYEASNFSNIKLSIEELNDVNIRLDLNLEDYTSIKNKVAGVEFEFKAASGDIVNLYKSLSTDNFDIIIAKSELDDLVGKGEIKVSCVLYYDTGYVSWGTFEDDKYVSIQSYSTTSSLGDYYGYYSSIGTYNYTTSGYAMGSLFIRDEVNSSLIGNVGYGSSVKIAYTPFVTKNSNLSNDTLSLNVSLANSGLNFSGSVSTQVAKKVDVVDVSNSVSMNAITAVAPSIYAKDLEVYSNIAYLSNVGFSGTSSMATVDGKKYITFEITNLDTQEVTEEVVDITSWTTDQIVTMNLTPGTNYSVMAKAVLEDNPSAYLIDSTDVDGNNWVLEFTTEDGVEVSNTAYSFTYESYNAHLMNLKYTLSQTTGMVIKYCIKDTSGNILITNEQMYERGMLKRSIGSANYNAAMEDTLVIAPGSVTELVRGGSYKLGVEIYDTNGNTLMSAGNNYDINFVLPILNNPTVFSNTWVEEGKIYFQFSINDGNKIIMTDSDEDAIAYYYAKVFKVENDGTMTQKQGTNTKYEIGKSYTLDGIDYNQGETYQIVLYSTYDVNHDGKHDNLVDGNEITTSISGVDTSLFEGNLTAFKLYESTPYTTPSPTDISLGSQYLVASSGVISVEYTQPNMINNITRIEYSIIDSSGVQRTEVLNNSAGNLFVEEAGGFFVLKLPTVLSSTGLYNVTIDYYYGDSFIERYSGNCYYR